MLKVLKKEEGTGVLIEEEKFDDKIFSSDGIRFSNNIDDDPGYKRPAIKTWIYKNITDVESKDDYWVDNGGMPLPAEYKDSLNSLNGGGKKGVYIINSYSIPLSNIKVLEFLVPVIRGKLSFLSHEVRESIVHKIRTRLTEYNSGGDFKFRIVTYISKELYDKYDVISLGNVRTSKSLDDLYDQRLTTTIDKNITSEELTASSIAVVMEYAHPTEGVIELDICGSSMKLNSTQTIGEPSLNVSTYSYDKIGNARKIAGTNITGTELDNIKMFHEDNKELTTKIIDHENSMMNAVADLVKVATENDISMHKLLAQEGKSLAAAYGVDKDQMSLAKEGIKLVGGFL